MIKFKTYLAEEKLTHLTHLEDAIFNDGYAGGVEALKILRGVIKTLQGNTKKGLNITSKVDGAPSIIAGTNPETGKFFVATKALFNKTPKINYTPADIDANHGHAAALADKMKIALKYFPQLGIKGIWQGDFMFIDSDIKKETIDGDKYITFTPNTITYAVPVDQPLAKQMQSAKVGVIWHTSYTGKTIADLSAVFNVNTNQLKKSKDVWAGDVNFQDVSGTATLTADELKSVNKDIEDAEADLKKLNYKLESISLKSLLQSEDIRLFVVQDANGKILSARIIHVSYPFSSDIFAANSITSRSCGAAYFIMQNIFEILHEEGFKHFDFGRIPPSDHATDNIYQFKSLTGDSIQYNGNWSFYENKWLEFLMFCFKNFKLKLQRY